MRTRAEFFLQALTGAHHSLRLVRDVRRAVSSRTCHGADSVSLREAFCVWSHTGAARKRSGATLRVFCAGKLTVERSEAGEAKGIALCTSYTSDCRSKGITTNGATKGNSYSKQGLIVSWPLFPFALPTRLATRARRDGVAG